MLIDNSVTILLPPYHHHHHHIKIYSVQKFLNMQIILSNALIAICRILQFIFHMMLIDHVWTEMENFFCKALNIS